MKARKSIRPLLMAAALLSVGMLGAAPQAPAIRAGSASISTGSSTVINQSTSSLAIDWQSFDLAAGESVRFNQPSPGSVALNRVISGSPTSIFGRIDANGRVILVNSAGILFGPGSQVNTGAFVASTLELDESTLDTDRLRFVGNGGSIENAGSLNGQEFVAVVAPAIVNSGSVRGASVALAAGSEVIISTAGGLFDVQVPAAAVKAAIDNKGGIIASQGNAYLTARGVSAAASSLSNPGKVEATGMVERDGHIYLESDGALTSVGEVKASRAADGGDIEINGGFVALGGTLSADGAKGGTIKVESLGMLSLADHVTARGLVTAGGSITYRSLGQTIENSTGFSDVSGRTDGGKLSLDAEQGVMSSGSYKAVGATGKGGMIDLTGYGVRLLSATLDASGDTQGGLIRVGGAFQGGKNLGIRGDNGDLLQAYVGRWSGVQQISNAQRTLVNDSSVIKVSATAGEGGTAIVWSDLQTTMVGKVKAAGIRGGVLEISSAGELRKAAIDQVAGARNILLDPKNIVVGNESDSGAWTYSAIIGAGYSGAANIDLSPSNNVDQIGPTLDANDYFGSAVAVSGDGKLLVIGSPEDDGFGGNFQNTGSARLIGVNQNYSGVTVIGTIGSGYAGGGNINISLDAGDQFGRSVALSKDGLVLAVGAPGDAGNANALAGSGCVWLFSFTGARFEGGTVFGRAGYLYPGSLNSGWSTQLKIGDGFGWSVSLNQNGRLMAVGSPFEDDTNPLNYKTDRGNVRLFSIDTSGANESWHVKDVVSEVFNGYSNNPGAIEQNDKFGWAVSLNGAGDRLAIGAPGDDGDYNGQSDVGVVRLYSFSDNLFSAGSVVAFVGNWQSGWYDSWKVVNTISVQSGDLFGSSVSLSSDGKTMAVGAPGDDGYADTHAGSGVVHLFAFNDTSFSGGAHFGSLGKSYSGGKNVHVTGLESGDLFGTSVALNAAGDQLAVGATGDDGSDNLTSASGAVYLFGFSDYIFNGGLLLGTIGKAYGVGMSAPVLDAVDRFGTSISLNAAGDKLVVGAPGDDGAAIWGSDTFDYGRVSLFTFADGSFSGGALVGVIGNGYVGGKNIHVASLDGLDHFGASVSLNSAGDRLAVGAPGDDGATYVGSTNYDYGSVRLFTFSDESFTGGALAGVIGGGYAGGRNIDIAGYGGQIDLDVGDLFGTAVSLNAAGDRLAVGAPGDDGSSGLGDNGSDFGNVRLFEFADNSFTSGNLSTVIGKGFREGVNTKQVIINGLDSNDKFGSAVSLNASGNRVAVGAPGDDGATLFGDYGYDYGCVHLFAFAGTSFTDGGVNPEVGVVGKGYSGLRRMDVANLDAVDWFGSSVSFNAEGSQLAVGSPGDDGASYVGSGSYEYGNVRLFTFQDLSFGGGVLSGLLGKGYVGGQNVDIASLDAVDRFGSAVSFNALGDRLAVGSSGDDGATYVGSGSYDYGSVMLFKLGAPALGGNTFGSLPGASSLISSAQISSSLASGTSITLQANNDITISDLIDAGEGSIGGLLLYAGRNVRFDSDVRVGSRGLGVIANASAADGVIGVNRDAGQGGFTMAPGVSVVAGDFAVLVRGVDASPANPNSSPGSVTLGNVTADSLTVGILGSGLNGRSVAQNVGSTIAVSGDVTLVNQVGSISLSEVGNGPWSGLITAAALGDLQMRALGALSLDDLVAASFDVRSSGTITASGDIALGNSGYGVLSGANVLLSGKASIGAGADFRVNANDSITLAGFVPDLGAGAKVRLYACDDLTVSASVVAAVGSLGEIRLTAGRDLKIEADLRLGGADLLARANAKVSDGIYGSYRPAGQGDFTMAAGTTLVADSATVIVRGVDTDVTNVNSAPGSLIFAGLSLGSLTATVEAGGLSGRTIGQHAGSSLTISGDVILTNQAGDISLSETGNGAWSGTASLLASGSLAVRTSSGLTIDSLSAASFDVRAAGVVNVSGPVSLGASGYGFISSTSATFSDYITLAASADLRVNASGSITLAGISPSLASGSKLRFYGCDDVIVSSAITATTGSTGELRLTAGRDVRLNASLDLGSADLLARANASVTDGIYGAYRPVGQGDFTMASGTSLEADSVTVIVRGVDTDGTNVNSSPGGIVLADVEAGSLTLAIEGLGFTDRAINQYVGSSISVAGNASVSNSLGNTVLSSALNGAWRGTTTLSSAGTTSLKVSSSLTLGGLSASDFTVVSSGPMRVSGTTSLGSFGSGLLQAPGIDVAGSVSAGMFSTLNVVSSREMRLTGASASMATGSSLRLWSTNLAIDPSNRIGYNYRAYGATYGVTSVTSAGIGWLYSLGSPYALTVPSLASSASGLSLQSATLLRPAEDFFRPLVPLPESLRPRFFEPQWPAFIRDLEGGATDEPTDWLLDAKRESASNSN